MLEFRNGPCHLILLTILISYIKVVVVVSSSEQDVVFDQQILLDFEVDKFKTFKLNQTNERCTLVITSCSSPIEWNVFQSTLGLNLTSVLLHSSITVDQETYAFAPMSSFEYVIKLKTYNKGYGFLFAQRQQQEFPENQLALKNLQMKWKNMKELVVRWPRRFLNQDQFTCLVSSTERHFPTLCSILDFQEYQKLINSSLIYMLNYQSPNQDRFINCTTTTNTIKLKFPQTANNSKQIMADLFLINKRTNFAQRIGSNKSSLLTPTLFLKENKMAFVKLNEPVAMTLKVQRNSFTNSILDIYVVPCNVHSRIDIDIFFDGKLLNSRKGITAFGKISVPNVQRKKNYVIHINRRDVAVAGTRSNMKLAGVQVFATTLSSLFNPFPEMPRRPSVKEYKTLRTCHSVTVGWIPPNGLHTAYYCMIINKGKVDFAHVGVNQCQVEKTNRRHEMRTLVSKTCKQMKHTARISVITQKVDKLTPGTFYSIQIIVRKPKGRTLPYEILQVRTKSQCN